jgi:hypothetical protein
VLSACGALLFQGSEGALVAAAAPQGSLTAGAWGRVVQGSTHRLPHQRSAAIPRLQAETALVLHPMARSCRQVGEVELARPGTMEKPA